MTNKERQQGRFLRDREKRLNKRKAFISQYCDYEKIISIEALEKSFSKCRKGVAWKASTQNFELSLYQNLAKLHHDLSEYKDISKGYHCFKINERGKVRDIEACHISERVVQKSFSDNCFTPIFDHYVIPNNCASQNGKGTEYSVQHFAKDLKRAYRRYDKEFYIIQCDLKNYFGSIPHDKLINVLSKYISDERILEFCDRNIRKHGNTGLGLGSQNNQNYATIYLNGFDHYVTNQSHIKYYGRFNDDFYLMVKSKDEADKLMKQIRDYINSLGLMLSEKKCKIVKCTKTIIFLKQRFNLLKNGEVLIRGNKKSATRIRRKMKSFKKMLDAKTMNIKDITQIFKSSIGMYKHRRAYKTVCSLCNYFNNLFINDWLKEVITT